MWRAWCRRCLLLSLAHLLGSLCIGLALLSSPPDHHEPWVAGDVAAWIVGAVVVIAASVFDLVRVGSWTFYVAVVCNALVYGFAYTMLFAIATRLTRRSDTVPGA